MNASRRDWRLVAAGVAAALLALVVVGRLQSRNLSAGDAGPSRATRGTVSTEDRPVGSGLAVAGRVALPSPAVAAAVGAGAVWVLLEQGTLLRVDPDRYQVSGRMKLVVRGQGGAVGPLAVEAGAVWVLTGAGPPSNHTDRTGRLQRLDQRTGQLTATTPLADLDVGGVNGVVELAVGDGAVWLAGPYSRGLHGGGILLRIDPASGRVAGWLRDPRWFFQNVLAAGPHGVWVATAAPELLHVTAA